MSVGGRCGRGNWYGGKGKLRWGECEGRRPVPGAGTWAGVVSHVTCRYIQRRDSKGIQDARCVSCLRAVHAQGVTCHKIATTDCDGLARANSVRRIKVAVAGA